MTATTKTGDASGALAALADEMWQWELAQSPTHATTLGIPGYDDKLADIRPPARAARLAAQRAFLARAQGIDPAALSRQERVTRAVLVHELEGSIRSAACKSREWQVDHLWGPHVWLLNLASQTRIETPRQEDDFIARLTAFGPYMDAHIANLRAGLASDLVAPRMNVDHTLHMLDDLLAVPVADSPLLRADHRLPEARKDPFRARIQEVVTSTVRPAFERYRDLLRDDIAPRARDTVGLTGLPLGEKCYAARAWSHTSLDMTPQQVHEVGLAEMARIRGEMETLAAVLFPGVPLPDVLTALRDDPKYAFRTREEVEVAAVAAVKRAEAALPAAFKVLPRAPVTVKRLEAYAEKTSPMAYYRGPATDGSRPGTYFVNTYLPDKRPRYTAEVLAFHEAVPGHHLQIAIAQELTGIPEIQKHSGPTAFTEGWGLYSERVSDELGLYSGDLDRLGMLSFDAWRAARLVVDTGMHALGWTRQQAIDYMMANTASTLPDIENEVDRYITWPGQALAYKLGQLEILRLRAVAEAHFGDDFDVKEFHHRVLRNGAVPLSVLASEIDAWIAGGE